MAPTPNVAIEPGWLSGSKGSAMDLNLMTSNGFFYFKDGSLLCVITSMKTVRMAIVNRTKREFFNTTVKDTASADPLKRLIVNGSYCLPGATDVPCHNPNITIIGDVFDKGASLSLIGEKRKDSASLYLDDASPPAWKFAISEPPSTCTAGLGGLVPLVIGGAKIDRSNERYKGAIEYKNSDKRTDIGRLAVAASKDSKYLLIALLPDAVSPGLTMEQIRDKLAAADMSDAVLLDGSDSVMMYLDFDWKASQGLLKSAVTKIGLAFFYPKGTEPHTIDIDTK